MDDGLVAAVIVLEEEALFAFIVGVYALHCITVSFRLENPDYFRVLVADIDSELSRVGVRA